MPICEKLKKFLDDNRIRYIVIAHSRAYTAQEIAASTHIKGKSLVKCVIVTADKKHYMVATNANQKINLDKLKKELQVKDIRLAREEEFKGMFEDCEVGAMPPFGTLYSIPVIVDTALSADKEIAFNGGYHTSVVKMAFADFVQLVNPRQAAIAEPM